MPPARIVIRNARQNNLKGLDLDLPLNELIVVTGVSGSGKSSLAFDTIYAEGQRRYVETFSPYARQFLDRMDKPQVDRIEGIPPAIAIDQTNPVRTSRSTVGTMTELNDHLKLLFARAARLYCRGCGQPVRRDTPDSDRPATRWRAAGDGGRGRCSITFPVAVPANFTEEEVRALLAKQGYDRILERDGRRAGGDPGPGAPRRRGAGRGSSRPGGGAASTGTAASRSTRWTRGADAADAAALLLRPALRGLRHPLPRPVPEPLLVQLARSAPARPAAGSGASSASTTAWWCRTRR